MKKLKTVLALAVGGFFLSPVAAFAQLPQLLPDCAVNRNGTGTCSSCDFVQFFANGAKLILSLTTAVLIGTIIIGGLMWIISGGNQERIKKGQQILVGSFIGVAFVFFGVLIVNVTIAGFLGDTTFNDTKLFPGKAFSTKWENICVPPDAAPPATTGATVGCDTYAKSNVSPSATGSCVSPSACIGPLQVIGRETVACTDVTQVCCVTKDGDGDGHLSGDDCDDTDADIFPGAVEVAGDGLDNNCDGVVDGAVAGVDADGDHHTASPSGDDCDDHDPDVYLGAVEVADGTDNDCDGIEDDVDADTDGYTIPSDCDDTDDAVHPGASEECGGTIDANCDGTIDVCPAL